MKKQKKLGILGGGQLGRMTAIAAHNWGYPIYFLDENPNAPVAQVTNKFVQGSYLDYDDVYRFGKEMDVISIEIENVNLEALERLAAEGKEVHPCPSAIRVIKDKGLQKQFYQEKKIPTAPFQLFHSNEISEALESGMLEFPFVQKAREGGYDGKGVAVIRHQTDLREKGLQGNLMVEKLVSIDKEIAVIIARNPSGDIKCYDPVEMVFDPRLNLVDYLRCPADIPQGIIKEAQALAQKIITGLEMSGLLAVEFFLTQSGELLVNEVAPRPHNSGHQTIDSSQCSQFEQFMRAVLDFPLGSTALVAPSVMVNIVGAEGYEGTPFYEGIRAGLAMPGVNFHLYGKQVTRAGRKMGHVTIVNNDMEEALKIAQRLKENIRVIAN